MTQLTTKQIVEALLFASPEPLTEEKLLRIWQARGIDLTLQELRTALQELQTDYQNRGIELHEVASGWRFQTRLAAGAWINQLNAAQPSKYSRALLETLALIVYRQPITRAEIESIRGVSVSSNIIKTLLEHEWISVAGHRESPGRPALLITTRKLLDHFNLKSLEELPLLTKNSEIPE